MFTVCMHPRMTVMPWPRKRCTTGAGRHRPPSWTTRVTWRWLSHSTRRPSISDVAGVLGWVSVFYRVGAVLVDGDDDIVRVGFGRCQGVEPFPQAATDDQYSGGFGVDNQAQGGS